MYLKNLLQAVASNNEMPLEVEDMANELIRAGCQDRIIFHPANQDPSELQGVFCQYTTRPGVYASPEFVTLIVYSSRLPIEWQRLVCCKELIHVCDSSVEQTNTEEEVQALLDKILGPLSTEDFGVADIMAAKDKFAIYQALAILFPLSAREEARDRIKRGFNDIDDVVAWTCLPKRMVEFVLSDEWPGIREEFVVGWSI
ncbi:hypothetical protein GHK46_14915 [Sinorhizobium medicae]|uniref:hypothetical protein n=1 Tax=Sinorhizobium medicae TaxID=110321 RepID=UPI001297E6E7|nr:hypothetical protein [Sinorhizobium medicae]MQV98575.1 hypothetical protein [Sinorhizobium medicae]